MKKQWPTCWLKVSSHRAGQSPWPSTVGFVRKKICSLRVYVDYRKLNSVTKFDAYPLPHVDETLNTLAGAQWFSTLDLILDYWQVGLTPEVKVKSVFCVISGLYLRRVMPFSLCNAPSTLKRLMETVLQGLHWKECLAYQNNIVMFGKRPLELLKRMDDVFERLHKAGFKIKPKKGKLFRRETEFIVHVINGEGVKFNSEKISAIKDWPVSECVCQGAAKLSWDCRLLQEVYCSVRHHCCTTPRAHRRRPNVSEDGDMLGSFRSSNDYLVQRSNT